MSEEKNPKKQRMEEKIYTPIPTEKAYLKTNTLFDTNLMHMFSELLGPDCPNRLFEVDCYTYGKCQVFEKPIKFSKLVGIRLETQDKNIYRNVIYDSFWIVGELTFFPRSMKTLTFDRCHMSPGVDLSCLPELTSRISMNGNFASFTKGIPPSITELDLSESIHFNQPLVGLPSELKTLSLGFRFNQSLDGLPDGLTSLDLSKNYDFLRPLPKLPSGLRNLKIGNVFDSPLDDLPPCLTELDLSASVAFNQPLDNLPPKLTRLALSSKFAQKLDNLPESLKSLDISKCMYNAANCVKNLPKGLTELIIRVWHDRKDSDFPLSVRVDTLYDLPESLFKMVVNVYFNGESERIPKNKDFKVRVKYYR